ncbi:hypothetical protein PT974_04298 [Cladobotryum mycophilum]|uniref:DUF6590 domain-containing protein n=1 Tax=Cladobotryum mycophilum TaxID=491253 RepID=A0ABR0SVU0_9HYPO
MAKEMQTQGARCVSITRQRRSTHRLETYSSSQTIHTIHSTLPSIAHPIQAGGALRPEGGRPTDDGSNLGQRSKPIAALSPSLQEPLPANPDKAVRATLLAFDFWLWSLAWPISLLDALVGFPALFQRARCQHDAEGNLDYDWDPRDTPTAAVHAQTPRDSTIEKVTEQFENLSTGSYDQTSEDQSGKSKSNKPKSKPKHRTSSNDKDVGQGDYSISTTNTLSNSLAVHDDYETSQYVHGSTTPAYYQQHRSDPKTASTYTQAETPSANYATNVSTARHDERERPNRDHEDELADTIAASQSYYDVYANTGESSSSSAYVPYDETEDEGPPTPKAQETHGGYHITAEETLEELDPRYRVEPSSRFQPGEIFKVHWSEPQGSGNDGAPSVSGKHEIQNRFGTKFFVGFRRFIVIANDQGHCTCVPILTYGGKACKKKGVKADKHGIIYERGHKARLLEKEPKLGFSPVRVEMKEEGEKLSKESRVNYSKLVTVEHNVKVFFIGSVVYSDWELVRDAVNSCWNKKNHQKQRHR